MVCLTLTLDVQYLSSTKYQTVLARGSTMASVTASLNETLVIIIRQVIAIKKWPNVYISVRRILPLFS